ncbi:hypothetical protein M427DRAFT_47150 [Gonapodya prolifera JEL478]|uniref:Uncharacterized protein n=1 Tax=Gonapodya prolifera (strain JEL478) TaxID=1344416 RepID=A0A139A4L5_GONPJ|nr:hypothetical protein M427DRAFT_47150 [Gonapodya prolifera JEL478]|eukprot:KXS11425.1 hypothetical protein M427DRAFT_47150 [Gonapodya prolifera JEL478]
MSDLIVWSQSIDALQVVTCVACGIHLLGQLAMLRWVWLDIKWNAFKKIGADRALQWRYSAFTFLTVEIKVSIYFALLGGIYLGSHGLWSYSAPFLYASTTIYALYATSLLALFWASRKEYFAPVLAFLVVGVAFEVILVMHLSQLWPIPPSFDQDTFFIVRDVGTFFCVFNIFIVATILATGALCAFNFGRGLRDFVDPSHGASSLGTSNAPWAKGDLGAEQDTRNVWALE